MRFRLYDITFLWTFIGHFKIIKRESDVLYKIRVICPTVLVLVRSRSRSSCMPEHIYGMFVRAKTLVFLGA